MTVPISYSISYKQYVFTSLFYTNFIVFFITYLCYKGFIIISETKKQIHIIILYFCEFLYLLSSIFTAIEVLIPPTKRKLIKLTENDSFPDVDVYITCCHEELNIIKDTMLSALSLNYPDNNIKIWILDDGGDDDLQTLCHNLKIEEVGDKLQYIRRIKQKGIPHHYKAGNINNAFDISKGEYIVIIDADMILHTDYLLYTLPYIINDNDVAFIQIPQSFYNIQDGDPFSDSQNMWYYNIMLHRDRYNCVSCCGTGALFKRSCLMSVGGFATRSITEDVLTSTHLFDKGYKSIYVNCILQAGLAPCTFRAYLKQRDRWERGALQLISLILFQIILNPKSKLSFYKRLIHFWYFASYIMYVVNATIVIIIITILIFDLDSYPGNANQGRKLIYFLTPVIVFFRLYWITSWLHIPNGIQQRNRDEQHFWWMTFYMCVSIITWFTSLFTLTSINFISTGSIDRKQSKLSLIYNIWTLKYHILYIVFVLFAVIWRILHLNTAICKDIIFVIGFSFFLLLTAVYMSIPIWYGLLGDKSNLKDRQKLIKYNKNNVPIFDSLIFTPRLLYSIYFYEIITLSIPILWSIYFIMLTVNFDITICKFLTHNKQI
jgi:cellulose synthase/poly-beta-1,6-N-acetylglucosamine synthase-like glycosyltransferase